MYLARILTVVLLIVPFARGVAHDMSLLPVNSEVLGGYERDSVENRMMQAPLHAIEGVWQFLGDGAIIAIEQFDPDMLAGSQNYFYRMVIVKSPMLSIRPGTVMGYVSATAKMGCYEAYVYTSGGLHGLLSKPRTFTLTLTDDNRLVFSEYKKEVKVNLWRWLPYVYRVGLSIKDTRPKGLDGCVRLFPQPVSQPLNPRYL